MKAFTVFVLKLEDARWLLEGHLYNIAKINEKREAQQ